MVVQRNCEFSPGYKKINSEITDMYLGYSIVHMIATKSGCEGKGYAQKLLDYFITKQMSNKEHYIFIVNRPNSDFLVVDETNWEHNIDDSEEMSKEEKMFFHIGDSYKEDILYSAEQVDEIVKGTKEAQVKSTRATRGRKMPMIRYKFNRSEKKIADLILDCIDNIPFPYFLLKTLSMSKLQS